MMLGDPADPPEMWPTLMTAGSTAGMLRPTIACAARMKCAITMVGSVARCGAEPPWPPVPPKVTVQVSLAASIGPGRMPNSPTARPGLLCMP
jgi:hypothetical protein